MKLVGVQGNKSTMPLNRELEFPNYPFSVSKGFSLTMQIKMEMQQHFLVSFTADRVRRRRSGRCHCVVSFYIYLDSLKKSQSLFDEKLRWPKRDIVIFLQ